MKRHWLYNQPRVIESHERREVKVYETSFEASSLNNILLYRECVFAPITVVLVCA